MTISYKDNFSEFNAQLQPGIDAGTGVSDRDPTAPNGSSPLDIVNQNLLLENSHFAFDPGNYV